VTRLKARAGLDPRERERPCDPGAAEKLTAEVFGHGRAETAFLRAVATAAAGAGGGGSVTIRVPGACASLLEALVSCGFRIGAPDAVHGLAGVRPT
jgi:hypothetical protein